MRDIDHADSEVLLISPGGRGRKADPGRKIRMNRECRGADIFVGRSERNWSFGTSNFLEGGRTVMLKGQYSRGPVCETLERTQQLFTEERVDRVRMGTANRVLEPRTLV